MHACLEHVPTCCEWSRNSQRPGELAAKKNRADLKLRARTHTHARSMQRSWPCWLPRSWSWACSPCWLLPSWSWACSPQASSAPWSWPPSSPSPRASSRSGPPRPRRRSTLPGSNECRPRSQGPCLPAHHCAQRRSHSPWEHLRPRRSRSGEHLRPSPGQDARSQKLANASESWPQLAAEA